MAMQSNPPRNGEGDHAEHGGGVESKRLRHRTVGAASDNVRFARQLRRKMTLPEVLFWQQLRKRPNGFRFRRQFPIAGYVLDFVCLEQRLAIEIDGQMHAVGDRPERDERRDAILLGLGFETLRIAAVDALNNLDGALQYVVTRCESRPLHHPRFRGDGPPPRSGEE